MGQPLLADLPQPNCQAEPWGHLRLTAEHGQRVSGTRQDANIGLRGGEAIRVGESVDELIICNDVAYHLENVIS